MLTDVSRRDHDGWEVVVVTGDLDLATIPTARSALDRTVGDDLALDLSAVAHLDPVALGLVLAASLRARRRGARFVVVAAPGRAADLLAESGLDRIVEVVADRDGLPPAGRGGTIPQGA